jgi:hypothetical protein
MMEPRLAPREDQDCEGDHQRQHGADHDEGERQPQVTPRRDPMQWYQHEASEPELARVQDHNDLLKMMRLHFEAARAVDAELTLRRRARLYLKLIARPTNVRMDLIIGVTRHVQDHLLATGTLIFFPLGVVFPFAMVMSMVSVLLLAAGELAELDLGDVAGEYDALGLPDPAGLAAA